MAGDLLESFRSAVKTRLQDRANVSLNLLGKVRWRPPQITAPTATANSPGQPVALPSLTAEDIAMAHTIYQAEMHVLTEMLQAVDEEFRRVMGQPAEPVDREKDAHISTQETERKARGIYG